MKSSDNPILWAKIGAVKFLTEISKDVLCYGGGCIAIFYNQHTNKEIILVANSPGGNGDGISDLKGHKTHHVFAYAENCKNARIFVKSYPNFKNIFIIDEGAAEGYIAMTFSDTSLLMTLGNYPKFTLTVWNWRNALKFGEVDTSNDHAEIILRCNYAKPVNMIHLCKNSKKLYYWDIYFCGKENLFAQHEVKLPPIENIAPLTHAMWTTEGGLFVCDLRGSIYTVDNEFTLERVLEANYKGESSPSIVWYKGGIVVCGPDPALRHYVKHAGIWACDWTTNLDIYLYKVLASKSGLVGVDNSGELFQVNEKGQTTLYEGSSGYFDDFCMIYPLGEYVVALRKYVTLYVFRVDTGKLISKYPLTHPVNAISANMYYPYVALSHKNGFLKLLSVYNPEKLSVIVSVHLSSNPIDKIKCFEKGRILVTASMTIGEFFIIEGIAGSQMKVVSHIHVGRQIVDYILIASKNCYRLYILPVASKYLAGNEIIRYCITDMGSMNVKKYLIDSKDALYYRLIPTTKQNRDRVFYAIPFGSRKIHEMETKRGDNICRMISEIKTGHLLRHFNFKMFDNFGVTWGYDGFIFIRDVNLEEQIAIIKPHHRYNMGVKKMYIDSLGVHVVSLGYDNVLCCTKIADRKIDEAVKQNLTAFMESDRLALMFKRPTLGLKLEGRFAGKTWLEAYAIEKFEKEQAECKEERDAVLKEFENIKHILSDMVTKNLEGPNIEKIDLLEFYLDALRFNDMKENNRQEGKQTQIYLKALITAQNAVVEHMIKTYWEPMALPGKMIRGIYQNIYATIYTLLPSSPTNQERLTFVEEQRKIEEFLSINNTFYPWLKVTKEELMEQIKSRHKLSNQDYNTMASRTMLEESQLTIESQVALAGCVTQVYVDRNPWHYDQRQLVSFYQSDLEQTIAENEVLKLKLQFNSEFQSMADQKLREMENIKDRHQKLRHIVNEYNYFSDGKIVYEVEDPLWAEEERPENILTVTDSELTVRPYVSPSEQAILDAKAEEEERIQRALLADDFREKALMEMMSGVLELRWEDELKEKYLYQNAWRTLEANSLFIEEVQDKTKKLNEILLDFKTNIDFMLSKEKMLEKGFRKDFQEYSSVVQEQALKIYRRRPKWNPRILTASSLVMELGRCIINQERSIILTPECLEYMKALDYLDEYIGIPPSIDEGRFRLICKHRRIRIECELKLRGLQLQHLTGEMAIASWQKRLSTKKEKNVKLHTELKKCKEDYLHRIHNIQIQIVLRRGLVEIPLTGDNRYDFVGAVLVPKKEIEHINELIKKAGNKKLKTIRQNMAFRRRIIVTEWEHKKLRMAINDLIEQINDINGTKLLKDMQIYLKSKAMGRKTDIESLEQELEVLSAGYEANMREKKEKLSKLQKQIMSYQEHNSLLDKEIQELNIDICALKFSRDPELDRKEDNALKARMDGIVKRSELVQTIQQNHNQILVLQTELELLRLRTYPTFKYKLINTEEKAF